MFSLDPLSSWLLIGLLIIASVLLAQIFTAISSIGLPGGRDADAAEQPADAAVELRLQPTNIREEPYDWAVHGL